MVVEVPHSWARRVVKGAAIMAAIPAMAELMPMSVEEMPRFSMMRDRSGRPRPMAMPTAEMAAMAAMSDRQ